MTTDLAFIGRLGDDAVAAAALGAHRVLRQLHLRHGAGLGGGAACRPGLRRPRPAPGAARGAHRPVGGASGIDADHGPAAARRADPAGARTGSGGRAPRPAISVWPRLGHRAGAVVHRHPRLHGRGQPAGADAVDHARRDPRQCAAGLSADPRRIGAFRSSDCSAPALPPRSSMSARSSPRCGS